MRPFPASGEVKKREQSVLSRFASALRGDALIGKGER